MKKRGLIFTLIAPLLVACDAASLSSNTSSSSMNNSSDNSSLDTSVDSSLESSSSSSDVNSSLDFSEPTLSSESSSSNDSVSKEAQQIYDLISKCKQSNNYTLTLVDNDGTLVRKYTPNAYYAQAPLEQDTLGYAQNENGVFSFVYENDAIVPTSAYLKNGQGEVCKNLYTATAYDQWEQKDLNIIYSFALVDLSSFSDLANNYTSNGYTVSIDVVLNLLPYLSQQQYINSQVKVSLTEQGLDFKFSVSNGFSNSIYTLSVSNIENTQIDLIEAYLKDGKGALSLKDKAKSLFSSSSYMYTREDTGMVTIITENYVTVSMWGNTMGYVEIPSNAGEYNKGIHSFMYFEENLDVSLEVEGVTNLVDTYGFDAKFFDLFEEKEGSKLVTNVDYNEVMKYTNRFDPTSETNIGSIELTYNEIDQVVTMVGSLYSGLSYPFTPNGQFATLQVTKFGNVNTSALSQTYPYLGALDEFLDSLNISY